VFGEDVRLLADRLRKVDRPDLPASDRRFSRVFRDAESSFQPARACARDIARNARDGWVVVGLDHDSVRPWQSEVRVHAANFFRIRVPGTACQRGEGEGGSERSRPPPCDSGIVARQIESGGAARGGFHREIHLTDERTLSALVSKVQPLWAAGTGARADDLRQAEAGLVKDSLLFRVSVFGD